MWRVSLEFWDVNSCLLNPISQLFACMCPIKCSPQAPFQNKIISGIDGKEFVHPMMSNFQLMFLTPSFNLPAWLSAVVTPCLQHSPWNTFMYTKCNLSSPPPPITIFNISIHISGFPDFGIMFVLFSLNIFGVN